jgi:threonine/homoserine/homoserine lactone efflux protein
MTVQGLWAFGVYAFVSSITPGPNNIMLLTSGVNFGIHRSLPHLLGVAAGFALMVALIGMGFSTIFTMFPFSYDVLQYAGIAYLLYLAWKVANAGTVSSADDNAEAKKPMSFLAACAFQWVNPKAWMIAVAAIGIYVPQEHYFTNVMLIAMLWGLINLPCGGVWAAGGTFFRHLLAEEKYVRIFNVTMALLLVASIYPVFLTLIKKFGYG